MRIKKALGLSLIELMVGLLVGTLVVAGGIKIFSTSVKNSSENIDLITLNQDLRTMLELMLHDIRRAGYVSSNPDNDANGHLDDMLKNNPFAAIQLDNDASCIVYMYNKNANAAAVENNERFGFKLATDNSFKPPKTVLRVRRSAPALACNSGTWESITAPEVEITDLNFTLTETPLNVTHALNTPLNPILQICNSGDKCSYVRELSITLSGRLKDEPSLNQSISGAVRIRNDQYLASAP